MTMVAIGTRAQNSPPESPPDDVIEAINRLANQRQGPDLRALGGGQITTSESGICPPTVFKVEGETVFGEPHLQGDDSFLLLGPIIEGKYLLVPDPVNSSNWGNGPYTMSPTLFPNFFDVSPNVVINPHLHESDQMHRIKIHIEKFENPGECPSYLWIWNLGAPGTPIPDDPGHGGARGY